MKIVRLEAENIKRLKAIEITPKGNMVVLGGKNGAGKSSALDSVEYALAGKSSIPSEPLRRGTKKGHSMCDLGDIIVKRTFTPGGGGTLTVENKEGVKMASPQALLESFYGALTFDPLSFARMDAKQQGETLRRLLGFDFSKQDAERQELFDLRTSENRELKRLESTLSMTPAAEWKGGPPPSVDDIMDQLKAAQDHNAKNAKARMGVADLKRDRDQVLSSKQSVLLKIVDVESHIAQLQREKQNLESALQQMDLNVADANQNIDKLEVALSALEDANVSAIEVELRTANQQIDVHRRAQARKELAARVTAQAKKCDALTGEIEKLDESKLGALASAKMPIDGLAIQPSGYVTFNGIPFDQASSAEKLRVSVAIGLAMSPELRVMLIRDGSLLDDEAMAMLGEMAEAADAQIWIERVEQDDHVTVLIEDGRATEVEAESQAT